MPTAKIKQPRVFISYAWSSDEYKQKVLHFAKTLISHKVDVIIDEWDLKEGNDTYAFMEKSVTDPSVTNVLILLNPTYEKKADGRDGGVGTETQIISSEIYNKIDQTKFLPVIFERYPNGQVPKPVYLKQTYHFDLSLAENFNKEYQRLVRTLYGVDVHQKPELGNTPNWVEEDEDPSEIIRITRFEEIKKSPTESERLIQFKNFSFQLKENLIKHTTEKSDCIAMYDGLQSIKKDFISLFTIIPYVPNAKDTIAEIFEDINSKYQDSYNLYDTIKLTLLHELFLYLITLCYKNGLYKEVGYFLNRSYYSKKNIDKLESYIIFYSFNKKLNKAINDRDNQNYYSGTAQYWMDTLANDVCDKEEFIFADTLCFNVSLFNKNRYWFPLSYVYDTANYKSLFRKFSIGLQSKERLQKASIIFGCESVQEFVKLYKKRLSDKQITENAHRIRFSEAFESPEIIFDLVKDNDLGIVP